MCDQTEVRYLPNDVVWIKLSNVWWPAEVVDESTLEEDITSGLKRKPLAIVKFFNEDYYEFPKNLDQIYHYNCLRKDEFIKKGLDLLRAQDSREIPNSMKKFPKDVQIAEEKTGGDPDYIEDHKFLPAEKYDYRNSFPLQPKKMKEKPATPTPVMPNRKTPVKVSFSKTTTSTPTEPRDHMFTPPSANKVAKSSRSSTTPISILKDPSKKNKKTLACLTCSFCGFKCSRPRNITNHLKSHYEGYVLPLPPVIPQKYKSLFEEISKSKEEKSKESQLDMNPLLNIKGNSRTKRKSTPDIGGLTKKKKIETLKKDKVTTPTISSNEPLNSPTHDSPKKRAKKPKTSKDDNMQESGLLDILKDWDDETTVEDNVVEKSESHDIKFSEGNHVSESCLQNDMGSENNSPSTPVCASLPSVSQSVKTPEKSCFDFEDNEDSLNLDQSLKFGQKLPRVINEKQSSCRYKTDIRAQDNERLMKDVDDLLESTHLPDLPDVPTFESHSVTDKNNITESENPALHSNTSSETVVSKDINEPPQKEKVHGEKKLSESFNDIPQKTLVSTSLVNENHPIQLSEQNNSDQEEHAQKDLEVNNSVGTSQTSAICISDGLPSYTDTSIDTTSTTETSRDRINSPKRESSPLRGKCDDDPLSTLVISEDVTDSKTVSDCSLVNKNILPFSGFDANFNEACHNNLGYHNNITESEISLQDREVVKKSFPLTDVCSKDKITEIITDSPPIVAKSTLIEDSEGCETEMKFLKQKNAAHFNSYDLEDACNNKKSEKLIESSVVDKKAVHENDISIIENVLESSSFDKEKIYELNLNPCNSEIKLKDNEISGCKLSNNEISNFSLDNHRKHKLNEDKLTVIEVQDSASLSSNSIKNSSAHENALTDTSSLPKKLEKDKHCKGHLEKQIKKKNHENCNISELKEVGKEETGKKAVVNLLGKELKCGEVNCETLSDINVADIPLPLEAYPEKVETIPKLSPGKQKTGHKSDKNLDNKLKGSLTKEMKLGELTNSEEKIVEEEIIPALVPINDNIELPQPTISPDEDINLDINSMPIVFEPQEIPFLEVSCKQAPSDHPNVDIVRIVLCRKGDESKINIPLGKRMGKCFDIGAPKPDFKPFHNLKRKVLSLTIPGPSENDGNAGPSASQMTVDSPKCQESVLPSSMSPASSNTQMPSSSLSSNQNTNSNGNIPGSSKSTVVRKQLVLVKKQGSTNVNSGNQFKLLPNSVPIIIKTVPVQQAQNPNIMSGLNSKAHQFIKPQTSTKIQRKPKQCILQGIPKNISLNKNINSQIKAVPQRLLQGRSSQSLIMPTKGTKQVQNNLLMKPPAVPNISGAKIIRSVSVNTKGVDSIVAQTSVTGTKNASSSNLLGLQTDRKPFIQKVKQSTPNILQKSPKKPVKLAHQIKTPLTVASSKTKTSSTVNATSLTPIAPNEPQQASNVVFLTMDPHGNLSTTNQIIPIEPSTSSANIDNLIISLEGSTNYIKIDNNSSSSSKKSGDILAEALANTQVFQNDSSELVEMESSVYQQFPTTSFSTNVLETSLTLNQPPIMSPLEVPSVVNTQGSITVRGKQIKIQPSMPLLSEEETKPQQAVFYSDSASVPTSHVTFQLVDESQIVIASSEDVSENSSSQLVHPVGLLSEGETRPIKEDNVLPEFLRGDFNKKPHKSKRSNASQNGNR